MAITSKPSLYSLNTGSAYFPDHLYLFDEATGTTANDQGAATAADMSLTDSAQWATDGTHGSVIITQTTGDRIARSSTFGSTLTSGCLIAVIKGGTDATPETAVDTNPAVNCHPMNFGDASSVGNYVGVRFKTDGNLVGLYESAGVLTQSVNSAGDVYQFATNGWAMVAMKFDTATQAWATSWNGAAWQGSSSGGSLTGVIDNITVGCRSGAGESGLFNGLIAACWAFVDDYSTWNDTFIASVYNSGDPWSQFLTVGSKSRLMLMGIG